jgi:prepilin-type N-terminal cleavage/methylation domain-containing protein
MKTSNYKTSKGFTLIELLVSMIITTIIITVLVTVTVTSLDIWNRNRSEVRASLQAKAMIDSMAADFESMVVRRGNNFQWLFAEFDGEDNDYTGDEDEGPGDNLSPSALNLIFFSAATDRYDGQVGDPVEDKGGDISGIGYQLVYKDPISELTNDKYKTFVLYRKLVNPDDTFQNLLGQADLKTAFEPYAQGGAEPLDAVENFICENVYQFTVKFHMDVPDPADAAITKHVSVSLDSSEQFIVTGNGLTSPDSSTLTSAQLATGRLTSVEISLSVITDGALRQLRGRTFTDTQLSDFIAENSYQYSKLIPVPSY